MMSLGQCWSTTDWNVIGACGQWANAFFTLVTAAALVWIAGKTYLDSRRQSKLQVIRFMNEMVTDWDKTIISRSQLVEKYGEIRNAVIDHETDNLVFMYLNFAHTVWYMRNERLMDPILSEAVLKNSGDVISGIPAQALDRLLARGYEPKFADEMRREAAEWRKRLESRGASAKDGNDALQRPIT